MQEADRIRLQHMLEAAVKLSEDARSALPDFPWQDVIDMRHKLVHAYYDINRTILWLTVQEDLPPLIKRLESILAP